jgi:propionate CoA-transferase
VFVTERVVLRTASGGLEIIEIAPGIDLERDVLRQMRFTPKVSPELQRMDRRLFCPEPMNLKADIEAKTGRQPDLR